MLLTPSHPANFGITDLHLAETNENGQVCFDGDVTLLLPVNKAKANGALLLEAPNRGHPLALRSLIEHLLIRFLQMSSSLEMVF